MKYLLYFILAVFLVIIQTSFFSLNFLILLLFLLGLKIEETSGLIIAFLFGLAIDTVGKSYLGTSSFFFLVSEAFVLLYRRKFSFDNPLVLMIAFPIFYFMTMFFTGRTYHFWEFVLFAIIVQLFNLFSLSPKIKL